MPYKNQKKERSTYMCDWQFLKRGNDFCGTHTKYVVETGGYRRELCMRHKTELYSHIPKATHCEMTGCENNRDGFGDGFCNTCGPRNRNECTRCNRNTVRKHLADMCKSCYMADNKCMCPNFDCQETAGVAPRSDGLRYCWRHGPGSKVCQHTTVTKKCTRSWVSTVKGYTGPKVCHEHGGVRKRKRDAAPYQSNGVCIAVRDIKPVQCRRKAMENCTLCSNHM